MSYLLIIRIKPILWLAILCITSSLVSCAQSKSAFIQNSQAFYKTVLPGNSMVGEDGLPIPIKPVILRLIYMETTAMQTPPQVERVLYNGKATTASIFREERLPVVIGITTLGQKVIIQPKSGTVVWRLEVDPSMNHATVPLSNIIIKGTFAGKPFTHSLKRETELKADHMY